MKKKVKMNVDDKGGEFREKRLNVLFERIYQGVLSFGHKVKV